MADDTWYRNTDWNEGIRDAFFAKLARSRSQRDQYLVIQASTIAPSFPEASLELVQTYFATRTDNFHDVMAYLAKAEAYTAMELMPQTIQAYKEVLAREAEFPKHRTQAYLELPYLIASKGVSSEYDFALSTLADRIDDITFPVDLFMWHAANALIAFGQGRRGDAADQAKKAVDVAEVKKSGFRYHQNVGLVSKKHQSVLKKLIELAS